MTRRQGRSEVVVVKRRCRYGSGISDAVSELICGTCNLKSPKIVTVGPWLTLGMAPFKPLTLNLHLLMLLLLLLPFVVHLLNTSQEL